jgi:excisionase family DNA binding protein
MRSRLVSVFSDALASSKVPVLDVATRYGELGDALLPLVNQQTVSKYGIEFASFIIENVSVPEEVEKAIDKRSSMAAIGNLNDYVKFQMAEAMTRGDAGGGLAGSAAQLGAGLAMGQQMMAAMAAGQTTPAAAPAVSGAAPAPAPAQAPASTIPELLTPAAAAQILGVTEADVLAALTDGSLKGKRIGTAWRITRSALEEFLNA